MARDPHQHVRTMLFGPFSHQKLETNKPLYKVPTLGYFDVEIQNTTIHHLTASIFLK